METFEEKPERNENYIKDEGAETADRVLEKGIYLVA